MLTAAAFLELQPEFRTAPGGANAGGLVDLTLTQTAKRISAEVFGELTDEAHRWLTADVLACSPFGRNAQLAPENGRRTMYADKFRELVELVGCGWGAT